MMGRGGHVMEGRGSICLLVWVALSGGEGVSSKLYTGSQLAVSSHTLLYTCNEAPVQNSEALEIQTSLCYHSVFCGQH